MRKSIRLYFLSIMRGRAVGAMACIVRFVLKIFSIGYWLGIKVVNWSYVSGIRKRYNVGIPVVSVGNITLGGTGKTPFVEFLAEYLVFKGMSPAVVIRGYGKDECKMLKDTLKGIPIFTGQDRLKGALAAERDQRDIVILDDGFQHRRLFRDIDIVLLDSNVIHNNLDLFPAGIFREPLDSLQRADIIGITKSDMIEESTKDEILRVLNNIMPSKPVIFLCHKALSLRDVLGGFYSLNDLVGKNIILLSAIGDPDYFNFVAEKLGADIVRRMDYPDHYRYMQSDLSDVNNNAVNCKADIILTTQKDYIKIRELDTSQIEEKLFVLHIATEVVSGKEILFDRLNSVISC